MRLSKKSKPVNHSGIEKVQTPQKNKKSKHLLKDQLAETKIALAEQNTRLELLLDLQLSILSHLKQLQIEAEAAKTVLSADIEVAERKIVGISRITNETVAEIRRSLGVIDSSVEDSNLDLSVQELLDIYGELGLVVKFNTQGTQGEISSGMRLSLFKMLKEALENSLQYGGPGTVVDAVVTWGDRGVSLTISDDGIRSRLRAQGLDDLAINDATKYDAQQDAEALIREKTTDGIKLLKKRVELYGGSLILQESPGLGLNLTISIPDLMNGLVLLEH